MKEDCDRCGRIAKTYFLETFNPCTGEGRTLWFCKRCMCTANRRLVKFAEGGR